LGRLEDAGKRGENILMRVIAAGCFGLPRRFSRSSRE
jgi:hypothetical protein